VHALATTGRTLTGDFLPLFVYIPLSASWFMPLIYYWSAPFLLVLPFAEWSVRVPTALIGVLSVGLMTLLARRLLHEWRYALFAAGTLACAPAFFMLSRYALDYIYPIPFILGWLLALVIALEDGPRSRAWFLAAGLCLGAGMYSYIASIMLMPVYFIFMVTTLVALKRPARDTIAALVGFAVPLIVFLVWFWQHPEVFQGTADRYELRALDVAAIAGRYVRFFDPDFLFFTGDTYLPFSTRTSGVFAIGMALTLVTGIYAAVSRRHPIGVLVLCCLLVTPVTAAVLSDPGAIRRATGMLPFGVLLSAFGARHLWTFDRLPGLKIFAIVAGTLGTLAGMGYLTWILATEHRMTPRGFQTAALGVTLLVMAALAGRMRHGALVVYTLAAAVVVQFALFQVEYHGPYRVRAAPWLNGDTRGALLRLMAEADRRPDAPIVFVPLRNGLGRWDLKNRWMPAYWRFYAIKHQRVGLLDRTVFYPQDQDLALIEPGSLMLGNAEDPELKRLLAAGATHIADIPEMDREPFFTLASR
jgi:4-amino-4-deoxy-L-arabinose transferase-like glycosyltransferase